MKTTLIACNALLLATASTSAMAQEVASATALPPINVDGAASPATVASAPATSTRITRDGLRNRQSSTSDTAALLGAVPGVAVNTGGGIAGMPSVRGLTEQRLTITVDGHVIDSACPNDMNTPLSYTDPQTVGAIRVITGVSPVSMGGDSIGGVIAVTSAPVRFASEGGLLITGEASAFYRSNDDGAGGALSLTVAGSALSATYTGSFTSAGRYYGGGNLGVVRSSEYRKTDHALALAWQGTFGLIELKGGYHNAPYEGFVNQPMDMTRNESWFINGHWRNDFDWGTVDLKVDYRKIIHEMNFLSDKGGTTNGGMPMNTNVQSGGYDVKLDVPLGQIHTLRLGHDLHVERMDDWWPPVAGSMMMGPNPFININNGKRDRVGAFAEIENRWNEYFSTVAGVRFDRVTMNTGNVAPYAWSGMMQAADIAAANAFNAVGHKRTDNNWSASLLASYEPAMGMLIELGYAHKVRSPNLYERYTWGRGTMASRMIGWYGDGNGYVGNLNLKPERADTISLSVQASGGGAEGWTIKASPYYTHVNDYIDGIYLKPLTHMMGAMMGMPTGFNQLQFGNVEAEFYGVDIALTSPALDMGNWGKTRLSQSLAYVHGQNLTARTPLYHQMPVQVKLALSHAVGGLTASADLDWVAEKSRIDAVRKEPKTAAYALVGLHVAYSWKGYRLGLDVENLLDKAYALPLGGVSLGDYKASGSTALRAVPGRGRSVNLGFSARF